MRVFLAIVAAALLAPACGGDRGPTAGGGLTPFDDASVGVAGVHLEGWHRARAVTNLGDPREVLVVASSPLTTGDDAGECAPRANLTALPRDGVFLWLLEYRPPRGDVWSEVPRSRFPPKRSRFALRRADLENDLMCHDGPGYTAVFRAANRPFQLFVAFGRDASDRRIAEVEEILNSLRFEPLPAPPPDPYAGWPLLADEAGDSLRPPPGWPGAAVTYGVGHVTRPRLLFFTANRPLLGLPRKLVDRMEPLGRQNVLPTGALANEFPPDGVVVFVLEEGPGGPSAEFPRITADWPGRDDFAPGEIATQPASQLRWLRAGGSFSGYRFAVWIGRAPAAEGRDLTLALKSAASLAVSGCRGGSGDCSDQ